MVYLFLKSGQRLLGNGLRQEYRRCYSVKEVPWCSSSSTAAVSKRAIGVGGGVGVGSPSSSHTLKRDGNGQEGSARPAEIVDAFGIVAAASKNRIIGIDGKLPWSIPEDRNYFTDLTRDKILILGRRTYQETDDGSHISHCHKCIVVSTSLHSNQSIRVARSFPEALQIAKQLEQHLPPRQINCWVVGGEQIYEQALKHKSASELHLTMVHINIQVKAGQRVTLFPPKYRWDRYYNQVSQTDILTSGKIDYQIVCWKRKRRR